MKKSAPHPATRKTPTGGTVDSLTKVSRMKWTGEGLTEDSDQDQEECFNHLRNFFLSRALMYSVMCSRYSKVDGCLRFESYNGVCV